MTTVLFVDDETGALSYYRMALEMHGYNVLQHTDPDSALEYARNVDGPWPDIVILDIMMPPGSLASQPNNSDGLRTGLHLYPLLRPLIRAEARFFVLSNSADPAVEAAFRAMAPDVPYLKKL